MKDINNWNEISIGYYRFVIGAKIAYEIIVEYYEHDTPIETAKASLCLVGVWNNRNKANTTEREWLAKELPIQELLEIAYNDNEENNK